MKKLLFLLIFSFNFLFSSETATTDTVVYSECNLESYAVIVENGSGGLLSPFYVWTGSDCSFGIRYGDYSFSGFTETTHFDYGTQHYDIYILYTNNCPPNSHYVNSDQGCVCDVGYILDSNGSCVDPCTLVNPPQTDDNGFPLQRIFYNINDCISYINIVAENANGSCKTFDNCQKVFGYFIPKVPKYPSYDNNDTNLSLPPLVDQNDTYLNSTVDNDNNYTTLNQIDTNNTDNIDLNPVLKSLSDMSLNNHNDFKNIANKQDLTNSKLSNLQNINQNGFNSVSNSVNNLSNINSKGFYDANQKLEDIKNALTDDHSDDANVIQAPSAIYDFNTSFSFFDILDFASNIQDAYENFTDDFQTLIDRSNEYSNLFKNDLQNGIELNLPHSDVTTCPYTVTIDFSFFQKDINIDFCKILHPLYPVFYFIFSFFFSVVLLFFAYRSIIRLL